MRLDRLLGITLELLAKKRVTAATLAAKFEVSVRTVYRDVELINQAGIPVASFTGADGGFELMDGFYLTRQHFSVDDLSVIYTRTRISSGSRHPGCGSCTDLRPPFRLLHELGIRVCRQYGQTAGDGIGHKHDGGLSAPVRQQCAC